MKRIGIIGGIGPESTIDYYKLIINAFNENQADLDYPEIIIYRLFSEIELGIIKDSTRAELLSIIKKMIDRHAIDAVILGCTELPLILSQGEFGISFLNTTAIHAESIVSYCTGKET